MSKVAPAMTYGRPHRIGGRTAILAAGFFLALIGLAFVAPRVGQRPVVAVPMAARPTVDPRLIIHARRTGIAGALYGGIGVSGSLYPTLPGVNTVRLLLREGAGRPLVGGRISLVVTMPGMPMAPIRSVLTATAQGYRGALHLPMFGAYRAQVVVAAAAGRYRGAIPIVVSLPRF